MLSRRIKQHNYRIMQIWLFVPVCKVLQIREEILIHPDAGNSIQNNQSQPQVIFFSELAEVPSPMINHLFLK